MYWEARSHKKLDNHHHHVHDGLGVFPVPWSSKWNWSLHLFLGHPMFLHPFGLYCNACFGTKTGQECLKSSSSSIQSTSARCARRSEGSYLYMVKQIKQILLWEIFIFHSTDLWQLVHMASLQSSTVFLNTNTIKSVVKYG